MRRELGAASGLAGGDQGAEVPVGGLRGRTGAVRARRGRRGPVRVRRGRTGPGGGSGGGRLPGLWAGQSIRPRAAGAVRAAGAESSPASPGGGRGGFWPSELQEKTLLVLSWATSHFVRPFAVAGRQRPLLKQAQLR